MEPRGTLNGPCNLLISHSTQLQDGASREHIYECALYPSTNGVVGTLLGWHLFHFLKPELDIMSWTGHGRPGFHLPIWISCGLGRYLGIWLVSNTSRKTILPFLNFVSLFHMFSTTNILPTNSSTLSAEWKDFVAHNIYISLKLSETTSSLWNGAQE